MANEDYISRKELLKVLYPRGISDSIWKESHEYKVIASMPSVQPKEEEKPKTDVLDKIRAEIEEKEEALDLAKVADVALECAYIEVLKIIDKYRKEG